MLWLEVFVILSLTWLPTVLNELAGPSYPTYNLFLAAARFFQLFGGTAIILFLVWTADGSVTIFGFSKPNWNRDSLVAICLVVAAFLIYLVPRQLLSPDTVLALERHRTLSTSTRFVIHDIPMTATIIVLAASVLFEEVLFRGYLISRLQELLGNSWNAVVVSAILFCAVHLYQGPIGIFSAMGLGVVTGIAFVMTKRLWPSLVAHLAINLYSVLTLYFSLKSRGL